MIRFASLLAALALTGCVEEVQGDRNNKPATDTDDPTDWDPTGTTPDPTTTTGIDADGDGWTVEQGDCRDDVPAVNPNMPEICNGHDDNCSGLIDEEDPSIDPALLTTWYLDADGDGFGIAADSQDTCARPMDYVDRDGDCDDGDLAIRPSAPELCNDFDDNCDGFVDDDDPNISPTDQNLYYWDNDGDGFGDENNPVAACDLPLGMIEVGGDCDDNDPLVDICHPPLQSGPLGQYRIDGVAPDQWVGGSVNAAGDFNGDGYPDLVVGAIGVDFSRGAAMVFYGDVVPVGQTDINGADVTLTGGAQGDQAATAVAPAGDVDGDGMDDLLVSALNAAGGAGETYVIYGGSGDMNLSNATHSWTGEQPGDLSGGALAGGSDVDGDGAPDFLIGAPMESSAGLLAGAVYLVNGPPVANGSLTNATAKMTTGGLLAMTGSAVALPGDLDGDGFGDVVVGAPNVTANLANSGAVSVLYGGAAGNVDLNVASDAVFAGEQANDGAGSSVMGIDDVDGDGLRDLLIGAPTAGGGLLGVGGAYVVVGAPVGGFSLANAYAEIAGPGALSMFGMTVDDAGDVNNDGETDVIVGSLGTAYLFLGPVSGQLDTTTAIVLTGDLGDSIGGSVAGIGDMDLDGFDDVAVGATTSMPGGNSAAGTTYLLHGALP